MTISITDDSEYLHENYPVCIEFVCTRCTDTTTCSVSSYQFHHPDVVTSYSEHGLDLHAIDIWNARTFVDPELTVTSESPWQIESTFELDDSTITIVLDDDLTSSIR